MTPELSQPEVTACCAPIRAQALDVARAEQLARGFAALGDPVRRSPTTSRSCARRAW